MATGRGGVPGAVSESPDDPGSVAASVVAAAPQCMQNREAGTSSSPQDEQVGAWREVPQLGQNRARSGSAAEHA
nr:hypothetical protein [Nocardioides coralli]